MSGKYKKHGGGKWILKYTDKIQGRVRVKGEENACLAPSKYEKTWNSSRSPLERLVNKAPPVESRRAEPRWHLQQWKGTWAIAWPKGERQIHRDTIHAEVRRPEVEECASKRYPLCDSETQHPLVKRVPSAAAESPALSHWASPGQCCCQNQSQVETRSLARATTKPLKHLEAVLKSTLMMQKHCSVRGNKRGMGRITETYKQVCADEPDRKPQDKPLKMSPEFTPSLKLSLQIWVSLWHT